METKDLIGQLDKEAPERIMSVSIADAGEILLADIVKVDKGGYNFTEGDKTKEVVRFYLTVKGHPTTIMCPKSVMTSLNAILKASDVKGLKVVGFSVLKVGTGKATEYHVSPRLA